MGTQAARHRWNVPIALGAVGALVCAATACSATGSGSSGNGFTYWSMWKEGEPQQKVIATAVADFEKQTGIKVKVQWQGRNNLQKLVPALNTNSVPDLVDGPYVKIVPALVATKQALGLRAAYDTEVDGTTTAGQLIPAKYLKSVDIDDASGQPWMLPYSLTSDAVWYNAATHPELKTDPPKTWDQFIALLDRLKQAGETPLAADGDITGYNAAFLSTLIVRNLGPGGLQKVAADKTGKAWEQPAVLDAAKKVEQLVSGGYLIKGYNASKWPAQQQKWADNKAALMFNGSWLPTETSTYAAKGFQYAAFPFPATDAGQDSMRADFVGFAVPKKAHDAKDAQKFAAFLLNKKYQDALGVQAKVIPVRADAGTSPEMADVKKALDTAGSFHQQNDGVAFPGYNEKLFWAKDDDLFFGKVSAEKFTHEMQEAQAAYWKDQPQ